MRTGDPDNQWLRISELLPRWFGDSNPVLAAWLRAFAWCKAHVYALIQYAALQVRIKTATDGWLDMIAADFFGASLQRKSGQSDTAFRQKIIVNLFRERATRYAITRVLRDLTGLDPVIFEPQRPLDTGVYGALTGYGAAGGYGSQLLPYQAFVTAFRAPSTGVPGIAGYGVPTGAYGQASCAAWVTMEMIQSAITDDDICDAINSVKPVGTMIWVHLSAPRWQWVSTVPGLPVFALDDPRAGLDQSTWGMLQLTRQV